MRCAECPHLAALVQNPSPAWLLAHGWTASQLAQALGVHRSTAARWLKSSCFSPAVRCEVGRLVIAQVVGGGDLHAAR